MIGGDGIGQRDSVFFQNGLEIRMRLPVNSELRDKFFHNGSSLIEHLHNLHRLRSDDIHFLSDNAGLIPQINRECAAYDDERQQQRDHLAAQCRDLIRQFG